MTVTITTNNQARELITGYDFTPAEYARVRNEFDYLSSQEFLDNSFFKYRGEIFSLDNFISLSSLNSQPFEGWDGYHGDSYFSGTIIKLANDGESVIVGRYYS